MHHEKSASKKTRKIAIILLYLMYDGAVDDAPIKLLINDLPKREHLDAEHNVANAIVHNSLYSRRKKKKIHKPKFGCSTAGSVKENTNAIAVLAVFLSFKSNAQLFSNRNCGYLFFSLSFWHCSQNERERKKNNKTLLLILRFHPCTVWNSQFFFFRQFSLLRDDSWQQF